MTAALFGDQDVNTPAEQQARLTRRLALGGALQLIRQRNDWNVNEAATRAGLAPMTYRRAEDGLAIRERSLTALDHLLDMPVGTVKRALADDLLMVDVVKLAGVDVRHVAADNAGEFLDEFAEQTRTNSPRQGREVLPRVVAARPWPAVDEATNRALAAFAHHVPATQPTDLEVVNRLLEQLARSSVQTEPIRELLRAAHRAVPDLIAAQLREAERDLAPTLDDVRDDPDVRCAQ